MGLKGCVKIGDRLQQALQSGRRQGVAAQFGIAEDQVIGAVALFCQHDKADAFGRQDGLFDLRVAEDRG